MPFLRRAKPALWMAAALCIAVPASASAAVTFGSDLGDPVTVAGELSPDITVALRALDPGDVPPGGVTAPSAGVITHWRVKKGAKAVSLGFRVIRGNTSVYQGGATLIPMAAGTYQFDARVPVKPGDAIGLDQLTGASAPLFASGGGTFDVWSPLLGPVENRAPAGTQTAYQLLINADLEPDADSDGFGDETQDLCPTDASTQGPCPVTDKTPPETTITKTPANRSKRPNAKFKFTSDDPSASFECSLKGPGLDQAVKHFGDCDSPRKYKGLDQGKFKFQVHAIDAAGNVDLTPAKDKFKVAG